MKKKHLRALNSLENWLQNQKTGSQDLSGAFKSIRTVLEGLDDSDALEGSGALPPPSELEVDPLALALFSDGGCRGNPGPGAFAFVVQDVTGALLTEGVEFEGRTTNNRMELSGPLRGLRELRDLLPRLGKDAPSTRVKVVTDSKYVVDGMKSWVQGWKARGWKKADGKTPENLELWQELDRVRQFFLGVDWVWVKGHGGHPQNEYCDRKANEAMDENGA